MGSPTQRTLKRVRDEGYTAEVVEKFNYYTKTRHDFCGFADIIAFKPISGYTVDDEGGGIVAIQATSGSNHSARREKTLGVADALEWVRSGGRIWIVSWRKKKIKRGGIAYRYVERREELRAQDFTE